MTDDQDDRLNLPDGMGWNDFKSLTCFLSGMQDRLPFIAAALSNNDVFFNTSWWNRDNPDELQIIATCNDVFAWACSDAETIPPKDLPKLEALIEAFTQDRTELFVCDYKGNVKPDARKINYDYKVTLAVEFWCIMTRNMRPQEPTWGIIVRL